LHGKSGVGKTRAVYDFAELNNFTVWNGAQPYDNFWNNYRNQDIVLFDDFRYDHCKFTNLIKYIDRYPVTINLKGSSTQLNSRFMFVVSNNAPETVYFATDEEMKQLNRRIDHIVEIKEGESSIVPFLTSFI